MSSQKSHRLDYVLLAITACLVILGIMILAGISADFSQKIVGNSTYYLFHQMIWGIGAGILFGLVAFKIPLKKIKKISWILILASLFLMVLVFIPRLGVVSGGAPRWINFGFFTFQPSEFLKLAFIIYLSALLASGSKKAKFENVKAKENSERESWKFTLFPFLIILAVIIFLFYFQSNASTLFLIGFIGIIMYFCSRTPIWHSLIIGLIGLLGAVFFITTSSYRINRMLVFLKIIEDPMKLGFQIKQALITIGSGGIFGLGLGMSSQKVGGVLPQTMSDSIFAVFAEETGFIGCLILIFLFLAFLWRGFKIAKESKDRFFQLFSVGFSSWICIQAFINIGAIIGVLPITGIPLPFISYGGSHIMFELFGVGLLLNISKNSRKVVE